MLRSPRWTSRAEPRGLKTGLVEDPLPAHAGLINAISLHLLLLNFSFSRGQFERNRARRGVNQGLVAGLGYLDWKRWTHTKTLLHPLKHPCGLFTLVVCSNNHWHEATSRFPPKYFMLHNALFINSYWMFFFLIICLQQNCGCGYFVCMHSNNIRMTSVKKIRRNSIRNHIHQVNLCLNS